MKEKILKTIDKHDKAAQIYSDLFRQDDETMLAQVIKEKSEMKTKRTVKAMIKDAQDAINVRHQEK